MHTGVLQTTRQAQQVADVAQSEPGTGTTTAGNGASNREVAAGNSREVYYALKHVVLPGRNLTG